MPQLVLNGIAIGCIYALVSCGFVWVYQCVGAVNFAHGELVMVGAYLGVTASVLLGWPPALSLVVAVAASALIGLAFQRVAYKPVHGRPPLTFIVVTVLVFLLQALFFTGTRLGRRLRATAEDQETARLMGVKVGTMIALTFSLSAALAALAGALVAPVIFVSPDLGLFIILKAFIAIVIGGFGSIAGTLVGGVFLGVIEVLTAAYVSSAYKDVVAFALLVVVLLVLPHGFFGERAGERA